MDSISDLKEEIQRLRAQNAELLKINGGAEFLFEKNPLPCLIADWDSLRILSVNEAAVAKYGYSREEFLRLSMMDIRPPDQVPKFLDSYRNREGNSGIYRGEWLHQTRDGKVLTVEITARNLEFNGLNARMLTIHDLTERKANERILIQNEHRLRLALGLNGLGVFDWDIRTGQVIWDQSHARMFGLNLEEFEGRLESFQKFVHPLDVERLDEAIRRAHLTPEQVRGDYRIIRPDGETRWIEWLGQSHFEGDVAVRMVGVSRDVTEERLARQKLQELDQFHTALIENTPAPIFATDREGRHIVCNRYWEKIVGIPRSEALGRRLEEIFPLKDAEQFHRTNQRVFDSGTPFQFDEEFETPLGSFFVHTSKFPIFNESGEVSAVGGIAVDISDLRRLQEEQIRNSKLEAVGRLAGGIAHDFNNLLATILGNVSLTRQLIGTESPFDQRLETVEKACRRAAGLTQQLLTFAKGGSPVRTATSLPELIRDTVEFALVGTGIEAEFDFPVDLLEGDIDPIQIGQVFQNLTINARDAMPEYGRIGISARNTQLLDGSGLAPGNYIELHFRDTGGGIPEDELKNIFEPYFTTKKDGSGLGLAVVHSIIARHDGQITVSSRIGEGTEFRMYLPASTQGEPSAPVDIGKFAAAETDFSGIRILVMDDEADILEFMEDSLAVLGFQVTPVRNGEEAIRAFSGALKSGKRFHLGILDVTIRGGMGGREAIHHLLKLDPAFPAIVASGYSIDGVLAEFQEHGFRSALSKPFTIEDLQKTILRVLGLNR